tara:strand:+ start:568 stop:792 length:225 start_codon:yes stop_codon:yes gene_type:complete
MLVEVDALEVDVDVDVDGSPPDETCVNKPFGTLAVLTTPQHWTVSSIDTAHVCMWPLLTWTKIPGGGSDCPWEL